MLRDFVLYLAQKESELLTYFLLVVRMWREMP